MHGADGSAPVDSGAAGRAAFAAAAAQCYEQAGIPWRAQVVWVSSPLLVVLTAPLAAVLCALGAAGRAAVAEREVQALVHALAQETQRAALEEALRQAVNGAPREARASLEGAVQHALAGAVASELRCAAGLPSSDPLLRPLRLAVHASMQAALARAPRGGTPLTQALLEAVTRGWYRYICGHRSHAFGLLLDDLYGPGDLRQRERVYERAMAGACCWYPHTDFLLASAWPGTMSGAIPGVMPVEDGAPPVVHAPGAALCWPDGWGMPALPAGSVVLSGGLSGAADGR